MSRESDRRFFTAFVKTGSVAGLHVLFPKFDKTFTQSKLSLLSFSALNCVSIMNSRKDKLHKLIFHEELVGLMEEIERWTAEWSHGITSFKDS